MVPRYLSSLRQLYNVKVMIPIVMLIEKNWKPKWMPPLSVCSLAEIRKVPTQPVWGSAMPRRLSVTARQNWHWREFHVSVLFTTELRLFTVQLPGTNNMEDSPGMLCLAPILNSRAESDRTETKTQKHCCSKMRFGHLKKIALTKWLISKKASRWFKLAKS